MGYGSLLKDMLINDFNNYPFIEIGIMDDDGCYIEGQTWLVGHKVISNSNYTQILANLRLGYNSENDEPYDLINAIRDTCWGLGSIEGFEDMSLTDTENNLYLQNDLKRQFDERLEIIAANVVWVHAIWESVRNRIHNKSQASILESSYKFFGYEVLNTFFSLR
jgi:hypothetical protein